MCRPTTPALDVTTTHHRTTKTLAVHKGVAGGRAGTVCGLSSQVPAVPREKARAARRDARSPLLRGEGSRVVGAVSGVSARRAESHTFATLGGP